MNEFEVFVRSIGLRPRKAVVADGKWHRCGTDSHPRKRNGAWKLDPSGRIGWAQDWLTMEHPATWKAGKESELPEYDPREARKAVEEARRAQSLASKAARAYYEASEPLNGPHPYLESKELSVHGCAQLRVDGEGWLVVPGYNGRTLQTLQRIAPDGTKRFWKGASVAGTAHVIHRQGATVNILAEGLATGLACFQAVPNSRVWVLWNTGNLKKPPGMPSGFTVIAADNDHQTAERIGRNPGIDAALTAAEAVGCGVAWPEGIEGTDWADYRMERYKTARLTAGRFQPESQTRREVDALIKSELMRNAVFVR